MSSPAGGQGVWFGLSSRFSRGGHQLTNLLSQHRDGLKDWLSHHVVFRRHQDLTECLDSSSSQSATLSKPASFLSTLQRVLVDETLPTLGVGREEHRHSDPRRTEMENLQNRYGAQLRLHPDAHQFAESVEESVMKRLQGMSTRAAGVLAGLSIVAAISVALQIQLDPKARVWQLVLVSISDVLYFLGLYEVLRALAPKHLWVIAPQGLCNSIIEANEKNRELRIHLACQRLAAASANHAELITMANRTMAGLLSARNSMFLVILVVLGLPFER
jgi:hypothetical protein